MKSTRRALERAPARAREKTVRRRTSSKTNALYRELFALSPDGILLIDSQTQRVIEFNDAACRQLGYTREEFAGLRISDYEASETPAELDASVQKALREGKAECDTLHRTKTGEIRNVHVWVRTFDLDGRVAFYAICRDVTASKQAALRRSEARYKAVTESATAAVITANSAGNIVSWNSAAEILFGYTAAEIVGQPLMQLMPHRYRERHLAGMDRLRSGEGPHPHIGKTVQLAGLRKDQSEFPLELSLSRWETTGGWFVTGIIHDITRRQQEHNALLNSEQLLARLQRIAHVGTWVVDLETGRNSWSDELYRIYGVSPGPCAPTESEFLALIHTDDRPLIRSWIASVMSGKKPGPIEFRVVRPDGTIRMIEGDGEAQFDGDNKPILLIGTAQDVTDRTLAQRTLWDSEKLLRESQSVAGLGSYVLDIPADRWTSSAVLDKIFGIDDQYERSVEGWVAIVHPEWRERMSRYFAEEVLREHGRFDMEYRVIRKSDGEARWVHGLGELTFDAHDNPIGMIGTIIDVTERKQTEMTLHLQSAALHAAADAFVITDRAGIIQWVNPAFTRLTGYTAEEAVGNSPGRLVKSGQHAPAFYKEFWETILAGHTWHGQMINRRKDERLYTGEHAVTPIRDASGAITHFVGIQTDITERLQLEAQFRQAQKMESVGQLASGIAHDFNNLLTVINGMSDLVLAQLNQGDPLHADVREILRAGERAATLTRQLLAFSRRQILEPRVLSVNTVVAGMESLLRRLLGEDVDLVIALAPDLGNVRADSGQLEQVITNMAVNARDAMPQGGRLTIETRNGTADENDHDARRFGVRLPPEHYVILSVSDSGVGMDEATRTRVFEPFFTTKDPGKGTGLGLSTVYGIVKQSHGYIWVSSEVGLGTSFKICLPQVTETAGTDRPGSVVASSSGTETILVVEDHAGVRTLASRHLERAGYTVLAAATGEEALKLLEGNDGPAHLLLTDVVMPGMSGRQLAERLARTRAGLKVLYMSGYTGDPIVRRGVLDAQVPFLNKPFTGAALLLKVREALDRQA